MGQPQPISPFVSYHLQKVSAREGFPENFQKSDDHF